MSFETNMVIVKADPPCVCGSDELLIIGAHGELESVTCEQCGAHGSIFDVLGDALDHDNLDHAQVAIWMGREATMMHSEG